MINLEFLFLGILLTACFSSFLSYWLFINIKFSNFLDLPNKRKVHLRPKLRIGGIAIFISTLASILFSALLNPSAKLLINSDIKTFFLGSVFIYFLGFFEDIHKINFFFRLIIQFCIAFFLWINGLTFPLDFLQEFISFELFQLISLLFTTFWIVGLINAINWMDGLDGLAAGISFLYLIAFSIISFKLNLYNLGLISIFAAASLLGFLFHNFYPSKLLMGDGGSYFLGFVLSVMPILIIKQQNLSSISFIPLIKYYSPLFCVFIPIWDMIVVLKNRILNGYSPFVPDKTHLHHRLMDLGFSQIKTVLRIYIIVFLSLIPTLIIFIL